MKAKIIFSAMALLMMHAVVISACEQDMSVDGLYWTFHRMTNGNSFHECQVNKTFREGQSFTFKAPCHKRFLDSVEISWGDKRGKMKAELITMPGRQRFGMRDVNERKLEKWTVHKVVNRLRIEFAGQRNEMCKVRWIRLYYGVNNPPPGEENTAAGSLAMDAGKLPLVDRIKLRNKKPERKCRVLTWDGTVLKVLLRRRNGKDVIREFRPEQIRYIKFQERWGTATGKNGFSVPFKAKRFEKNMLWFDKKEGELLISKHDYPIEKFARIDFNK